MSKELPSLFDDVRKALADIAEGEALRREKKAADPSYEPPQAGSIDSTLYLLNLKAFVGGRVGALLSEIDAAHEELDLFGVQSTSFGGPFGDIKYEERPLNLAGRIVCLGEKAG